jgi:CrcB protein
MQIILSIAAGGALGAVLRYYVGVLTGNVMGVTSSYAAIVGTMGVNVIGSFIMGAMVTYFTLMWTPSPEIKAFLTIGLLGAFTTFSAFSLDTVTLIERGQMSLAFIYVCASVILSITALFMGMTLVRQILS